MNFIMYKYEFTKQVIKFLKKQEKDTLKQIYIKIENLVKNPYNNPNANVMKWKKWHYRLRIWNIRFLYTIDDGKILIYFYKVDYRGWIYKK